MGFEICLKPTPWLGSGDVAYPVFVLVSRRAGDGRLHTHFNAKITERIIYLCVYGVDCIIATLKLTTKESNAACRGRRWLPQV